MNNITQTAISKVNEERTLEAVRKAQGIIGNIEREAQNLDLLNKQVAESQEALKKLADSEVTFQKVTGLPSVPANPSVSQATIIESVKEIVKARQAQVQERATCLGNEIANKLSGITATDNRLAVLRAELDKVTANTVTPAQIIGN